MRSIKNICLLMWLFITFITCSFEREDKELQGPIGIAKIYSSTDDYTFRAHKLNSSSEHLSNDTLEMYGLNNPYYQRVIRQHDSIFVSFKMISDCYSDPLGSTSFTMDSVVVSGSFHNDSICECYCEYGFYFSFPQSEYGTQWVGIQEEAVELIVPESYKENITLSPNAPKFIIDYVNYCNNDSTNLSLMEWVKTQTTVTDSFKTELERILTDARNNDPELGLGFDPIFNAQDYAEKGYVIDKLDSLSGFATLKGVDIDFNMVVRLKNIDNNWIVDGAGIVNIPEDKRIRD